MNNTLLIIMLVIIGLFLLSMCYQNNIKNKVIDYDNYNIENFDSTENKNNYNLISNNSFQDGLNLKQFITELQRKDIELSSTCFQDFDLSFLSKNDFVYCDPPYLITTGSYNDGTRGFKGWGEQEELLLLEILDTLNHNNIKFALSNVLEHKGKSNDILKNWIKNNSNYRVNYLDFNYANSNYQTIVRDKKASIEVLITNV